MNAETLQAEAPSQTVLAETDPAYTFSYDVTPGPTPMSQPVVSLFGPASMTALVTTDAASIAVDLLQQDFPPGVSFEFKQDSPILWHDFCGATIAQPTWITDFEVTATHMSFVVANPAGTTDPTGLTQPIIAGFTPVIIRTFSSGLELLELNTPDPTIVNIDPTGG